MTTKPARCCVLTQRGTRCANEPSPVRPSRMIGPVRLAACGLEAHQRALWSLPGFVRHDAYCGAFGCDRPSNAGICQKHRDMYRDFGITEYALLAQEAPMTEPTITPAPADDGEPSEGDVADAPLFVGGTDAAPAELVARWGQVHTAPPQPMSPDLDGLAALAARGQQPTAPGPTLADVQAELARERERAIAAERTAHGAQGEVRRGREAVARLEKLLAGAEERADRAELDAVQERARADEALEELATIAAMLDPEDAPAFDSDDQPIPLPTRVQVALMPDPIGKSDLERSITSALDRYDAPKGFGSLGQASPYGRVLLTARENKQLKADKAALQGIIDDAEWIVHHCGSYGATASLADRVLRLLPVERQRAILELQRAEAYIEVARSQARFLNPPPPEKLAEYAAKVAEIEARIAALDAGDVRG